MMQILLTMTCVVINVLQAKLILIFFDKIFLQQLDFWSQTVTDKMNKLTYGILVVMVVQNR